MRRFIQCDVFSSTPARGNGLAVVIDAEGLTTDDMQAFAAWTNLAETTFLLPPTDPDADYKVRIFSPAKEMLFAGHPTLGSCMSWLHAGGTPKTKGLVKQQCKIGIVDVDVSGVVPAFAAPATTVTPMAQSEQDRLIAAMQIDPAKVAQAVCLNNGPDWNLFELATAQDVLEVDSSLVRWPDQAGLTLIGPHPADHDLDYEVRNIAPSSGMSEDPITGSLNAAIAQWLNTENRLPNKAIAAQGTAINRDGRVHYTREAKDSTKIWIGGAVTILIEGTVDL